MTNSILADTHIWLWHLNGDNSLSASIKDTIDDAASKNELYISAISICEIAMLAQKQQITFNTSCQTWIYRALALPGVNLLPLSPEIAIESCEFLDDFHGDPADRIIIASAKIENLCLISRDKNIIKYCKKHDVEIIQG